LGGEKMKSDAQVILEALQRTGANSYEELGRDLEKALEERDEAEEKLHNQLMNEVVGNYGGE
jgi:hypothetical protein